MIFYPHKYVGWFGNNLFQGNYQHPRCIFDTCQNANPPILTLVDYINGREPKNQIKGSNALLFYYPNLWKML
jgi:hypothetical protein